LSITLVRPYFRDKLDSLGLSEHRDSFNFRNIPSELLDSTYHIETNTISSGVADQRVHTFEIGVTIRLFRRGYNDTVTAHEELLASVEQVYSQVLEITERTSQDLFDVIPGATSIEPFGDSNDNWQIAVIPFTAVVKYCF